MVADSDYWGDLNDGVALIDGDFGLGKIIMFGGVDGKSCAGQGKIAN